jgi:hypothetical protein
MSHQWLTRDTALQAANEKIESLRAVARRGSVTGVSEREALAVNQVNDAVTLGVKHLFNSSVGIVFPDAPNDGETWYISGAKSGGYLANERMVPWTHWLGRIATQLRNAFERGEWPESLEYGPPGREKPLSVGPLVDYRLEDGRIVHFDFYDVGTPVDERGPAVDAERELVPSTEIPDRPPAIDDEKDEEELAEDSSRYGLKPIIKSLDLQQDDQIRGPMDGVFVFTGGPGVGKTTIALHRIPFLINEQSRGNEWRVDEYNETGDSFFSGSATLIVVWKEHLVAYLRGCVKELVDGFPDENVRHIDNWINGTLRGYVSLGKRGAWKLRDDKSESVHQVKRSLTEDHLRRFLKTDHSIRRSAESAFRENLPKGFSPLLKQRLEELRLFPRTPLDFASPSFSVAAYEQVERSLLSQIPDPRNADTPFSEMQQNELRGMRSRVREGRESALRELTRYVDLLFEFYTSQFVIDELTQSGQDISFDEFSAEITAQREGQFLSRTDTYLLMWLIHLLTNGAQSRAKRTRPLPDYTHIIIDEAQYYEPLVLRLFGQIAGLPDGVLTIVGDLEQRISSDGGVLSWGEVGFDLGTDRVKRLEVNYRWTPEVFEFLDLFHNEAGITEKLSRPYTWRNTGAIKTEIHTLETLGDELDCIAQRINDLRDNENSKHWSITIVVPDPLIETVKGPLVGLLEEHFLQARWAEREDVKEHVDRIIVTDYSSIVGLEFDCVFAMGIDTRLAEVSRDDLLSAWVALTRARRFICVTRTGKDDIFERQAFQEYHVS